ncbi:MAG: nucleotidyltransferase family protein [Bacteroidota bacterium]|nr:nucleotidyltransferase family protein [Bacteroidota bacterium]
MIKQPQHIISSFSNELQLLILLSQHNLNKVEIDKIKTFEKFVDWKLFVELAHKHRLISHVLKQIKQYPHFLKPEIKKQLKVMQQGLSKKALLYSQYLLKISEHLYKESIPHTFFKGPLLSLELYNDIGFRDYRDIDLLVPISHIEKARKIIQDLGFVMLAPKKSLSKKQKSINYTISHHYHLSKPGASIEIELHWHLTNPRSYFPLETPKIIDDSINIEIAKQKLPYISKPENIVFLAAHGAIHQWYRLFWLKDFSEIIRQNSEEEIYKAWKLSEKNKLDKTFQQACTLSKQLYKIEIPKYINNINYTDSLFQHPIKSISNKDLRQQGIGGKIKFVLYRLKLKPDINYFFSLIFRLRTHFTDWEILPLPNALFFLYYIFRPFILTYKFLSRKN